MAQRRHHYERAFEEYLRSRRIPYVSVDEARKALLPEATPLRVALPQVGGAATGPDGVLATTIALKSFDFVIYGEGRNLLVDIKGRRIARRGRAGPEGMGGRILTATRSRLESWVTQDDIESLGHWQQLFGDGFTAAFVFVYWCEEQPPDALFQEVFEYRSRWYAIRAVRLEEYVACMKPRSARWRTVDVPSSLFERISQPFAPSSLEVGEDLQGGKKTGADLSKNGEGRVPSSEPALHPY